MATEKLIPSGVQALFRTGDVGISSRTIAGVLSGGSWLMGPYRGGTPADPGDFGRCHRMLHAVPGWRERIDEVSARFSRWRGLVEAWDELERLYVEESPGGRCPKLYERMHAILWRCDICGEVVHGLTTREGVSRCYWCNKKVSG